MARRFGALHQLSCSITGTKLAGYCLVSFTIKIAEICCGAELLDSHRCSAVRAPVAARIAAVAIDPLEAPRCLSSRVVLSEDANRIGQVMAYTKHAATKTTAGTKY